ncbi:MAG: hypothetical protein H6726_07940 [Sandaracinaceae bacterium]|nr:hypothetical protein [Sandaracinaceae bacterium]
MKEPSAHLLESIRFAVWSGFYAPEELRDIADEVWEDDLDEDALRSAVALEFERKAQAERAWPAVTDCDRLDAAFESAERDGFITLQNAGYTQSDGLAEVLALRNERGGSALRYCFYHGQDLERALEGDGLLIAFGAFFDDAMVIDAGERLVSILERAGLDVAWDGDPEQRILLPNVAWMRRTPR